MLLSDTTVVGQFKTNQSMSSTRISQGNISVDLPTCCKKPFAFLGREGFAYLRWI
jgi:hypothetical protein